jgi:predicted  nucleic acid-binding Zn-ribbon protein
LQGFLRGLVRFQELSLEISRLNARISQVPVDTKRINAQETAASAAVDRAKDRLGDALKSRREGEAELQDLEQKIDKYNDQSREVKTNEQYRAIMSEIENAEALKGQVEEKILLLMEEADELERKIREEEEEFAVRTKEFDSRRKALAEEQGRLTGQRDGLTRERETLSREIPADAMDAYVRVASLRGDIAMAQARDQRCTVCQVRIRPQVYSEIRRNDRIISCESCRRILYYTGENGPEGEGAREQSAPQPGGGETGAPGSDPA